MHTSGLYHLNKLLLLGSGLSTNLGMCSWDELLDEVAADLGADYERIKSASANRSRSDGSYEVADALVNNCGPGRVQNALIKKLRAKQNAILASQGKQISEYALNLIRMRISGIITTNWDTLATEVSRGSFTPLVWPKQKRELIKCLQEKKPFLLYLHGNIENPPLVVTRKQAEQRAEDVAEYLTSQVVALHKVIVIGYGFPDLYIRNLVRQAAKLAGSSEEVLILARPCDIAKLKELEEEEPIPVDPRSYSFAFKGFPEFPEMFRRLAESFDIGTNLLLLDEVNTLDDIRNLALFGEYTAEVRIRLHEAFKDQGSEETARLLNLCAKYLIGISAGAAANNQDRTIAGLLASLLVTLNQNWRPHPTELDKLAKICLKLLSDGDRELVGVLDPLTFALGQQAFRRSKHEPSLARLTEAQSEHLKLLINNQEWREADSERMFRYYEGIDKYVRGLLRHKKEENFRNGLLKANDVTRLTELLEKQQIAHRGIINRLKSLRPYYLNALSNEAPSLEQVMKKKFEELGMR